jgi:3-deoxy-D-manno-octulosonate 8-phosphate phosphatase (KDO 8-P phosphatase)
VANERTYKQKLSTLRTFLFDVDGVFTDNSVLLLPDTDPVRTFYVRDAYAVQHAVKEGLRIIIISGGSSMGVAESFRRLGVSEVYLSTHDKLALFNKLVEQGLDPSTAAYMGDDIPDLPVMRQVAFPCAPHDATEEVKAVAAFISGLPGGRGCVRDLLEQVLKVQGKWLTYGAYTW